MAKPLESSGTIVKESANAIRASTRLSTYSMAPTLAPSIAPSHISYCSNHTSASLTPSEENSPMAHDVHTLTSGLARLDQPKLQKQRYVVSEGKKDEISKLALGAKLERALSRRMSSQDACFTEKKKRLPRHIPLMEGAGRMSEKEVAV